jgi:NADH-ubiquinone oxidoreductase chain 5
LPFLSGFYSKDLILELAFTNYKLDGLFVYWLGTLSAGLTAFYSFRVFYLTFWRKNLSFKYYIQHTHELPQSMGFSLCVLVLGSLLSGFFCKDAFIGIGSTFWGNSIFILSQNSSNLDFEFISFFFKILPLIFSCGGIVFALVLNILLNHRIHALKKLNNNPLSTQNKKIVYYNRFFYFFVKLVWFLNNKWYFDYLYNHYIGFFILRHGYETFYKLLDKGLIEICGPQGLSTLVYRISLNLSKKQTGYVYHIACLFILSVVFLLCILLGT